MSLTWLQFVALVNDQLTVDANRRGTEAFRLRMIKNAVVDLQRNIVAYRDGHTTAYTEGSLDDMGYAQLGAFPAHAKPKAIWYLNAEDEADTDCNRLRMTFFDWKDRNALVCGGCCCYPGTYVATISPMGKQFMIYPKVADADLTSILLVWEGLKSEFLDGDIVPFPPEAAEAVAYYVKSRIFLNVNNNAQMGQVNDQLYKLKRRELAIDQREALSADYPDEEYVDSDVPVPGSLLPFGEESIPFLRGITTIEGATSTAFVTVPTAQLSVPFAVIIQTTDYFPFTNVQWVLKTATDAHDPANGVVRPDDYTAVTNERVWFKAT